jgi:hypothetical protein
MIGGAAVEDGRGAPTDGARVLADDGGDAAGAQATIAIRAAIAAQSTAPRGRRAGVGAKNEDPSMVALPSGLR